MDLTPKSNVSVGAHVPLKRFHSALGFRFLLPRAGEGKNA